MADTKWTKEQERAISDRGKGIIVSAAAGSGKTTVLIERMIQLLSDEKNKPGIWNLSDTWNEKRRYCKDSFR